MAGYSPERLSYSNVAITTRGRCGSQFVEVALAPDVLLDGTPLVVMPPPVKLENLAGDQPEVDGIEMG